MSDSIRIIKIDEKDNVAVVLNSEGANKGDILANGLIAKDDIPQGQKAALENFPTNEPVIKYGEINRIRQTRYI
jgi:galactarate dehydratase